jgi:hypothetical protein
MNEAPQNTADAAAPKAAKKPAAEEMEANRALLRRLSSPDGKRLPEYCVQAYAHYFTTLEIEAMIYSGTDFKNRGAGSGAPDIKAEPLGQSPVRILWDTLKLPAAVDIPRSIDFATLFIDLGRDRATVSHILKSQKLSGMAIGLKDFPLPISTPARIFEMLSDPTPEAAEMLAMTLRENILRDSKHRARLAAIRNAPAKYLEGLARQSSPAPSGAAQESSAPPEVDFGDVRRALQYLRRSVVKRTGNDMDASPVIIKERFNRREEQVASHEHRAPINVRTLSIQLLLDGGPIRDTKKFGKIAVGVANLLLSPQEKQQPEIAAILGDAPQFSNVDQLVMLGQALKEKASTKTGAARSS